VKRKMVTSRDVALRAGVSRTTVSFVLNNTPGKNIPAETRLKVLKAAEELGYMVDERARKIAMIKHYSIGLFICHTHSVFCDAYIVGLIEGMAQVLNKNRFQLVLQPLRLKQANYLQLAREDEVDGVILLNTHDHDQGLAEIVAAKFPLVVIGSLALEKILQVDIDNFKAAKEIVEYLIDLGHRDIAMIIHASLDYYAAQERLKGYRSALSENNIPCREELVMQGDFSEESGYQATRKLFAAETLPTAIFAGNDVIAYGVLKAAKDMGLSIPKEISIAGFDDDFASRYLNPQLTTVSVPAPMLGAKAAQLLIDQLNNRHPYHNRIILPTHIARRQSCESIKG